jgi:hypothetical protein
MHLDQFFRKFRISTIFAAPIHVNLADESSEMLVFHGDFKMRVLGHFGMNQI